MAGDKEKSPIGGHGERHHYVRRGKLESMRADMGSVNSGHRPANVGAD